MSEPTFKPARKPTSSAEYAAQKRTEEKAETARVEGIARAKQRARDCGNAEAGTFERTQTPFDRLPADVQIQRIRKRAAAFVARVGSTMGPPRIEVSRQREADLIARGGAIDYDASTTTAPVD